MKNEIPPVLIATWIHLIRSEDIDQKVKDRALSMLKKTLGSNEKIALYMKKNNLK
jgi:hypothetical protein